MQEARMRGPEEGGEELLVDAPEHDDDAERLLSKWDRLKQKEERQTRAEAAAGDSTQGAANESAKELGSKGRLGMAGALLHAGYRGDRQGSHASNPNSISTMLPVLNPPSSGSVDTRRARRSSYSIGYGPSSGGAPSFPPPAQGASSSAQLFGLTEAALGGLEPPAQQPLLPAPSQTRRRPVRRTATVADLGLNASPGRQAPFAGGLILGAKGSQIQAESSGPPAFAKQSSTLGLFASKPSKEVGQPQDSGSSPAYSRQASTLAIFGKLASEGSSSSKHSPMGLFNKNSASGEKPTVVPRTPSLSMRADAEACGGKEGLGGKLKRMVQRSKSRVNIPAHSPPSSPSTTNQNSPSASPAIDWDEEEDALASPANFQPKGVRPGSKPGASRLSRSLQQKGSEIKEDLSGELLEAEESSKQSAVEGLDSDLEGGGQQPGQRRVSGPSPAEIQLMGVQRSASFRRSMHKGVGAYIRPLTTLPPFVPRLLKRDIATNEAKYSAFDKIGVRELTAASRTLQPSITDFQGAVMIADVKGFTQLTEILSKTGTSGVELLTNCMNNYFTRVMNMILAFDGDVVKFAGDSMIVTFAPSEEEVANSQDGGLYAATVRSMQCAHVLATRLGHMRMKMNGQVEPINNMLSERVVESSSPQESDLLRHNSTLVTPSVSQTGPPPPYNLRRTGINLSKAPGGSPPPPHSRMGPQQDGSPARPPCSEGTVTTMQAVNSPPVLTHASMPHVAPMRSLATTSGVQPSLACSSTTGSVRSGSGVQGPDRGGASNSSTQEKPVPTSSAANPAGSATSMQGSTATEACARPDPLHVQPTSISAGSGTSPEVAVHSGGALALPAALAVQAPPGPPEGMEPKAKQTWLKKIIPAIGVDRGGGGGRGGSRGPPPKAATQPSINKQSTAPGQVDPTHSSNSSLGPSGNSQVEESSALRVQTQQVSATSSNGHAQRRGSMAVFNTSSSSSLVPRSRTMGRDRQRQIAAHDASSLWGPDAGGFAKREVSVATRLNIPPPVRMLKPPASRQTPPNTLRHTNTMMSTQSSLSNELMESGGGPPTNMTSSALQAPHLLVQQQAAQTQHYVGSFTSGRDASSVRPSNSSQLPSFGDSSSDWRSKLQSLQSGLITGGGAGVGVGAAGLETARSSRIRPGVGRNPSWSKQSPLDRSRLAHVSDQLPQVGPGSSRAAVESASARASAYMLEGSMRAGNVFTRPNPNSSTSPVVTKSRGSVEILRPPSSTPARLELQSADGGSADMPDRPAQAGLAWAAEAPTELSNLPLAAEAYEQPQGLPVGEPNAFEWSEDSYAVNALPGAQKDRLMRGRDYLAGMAPSPSNAHIDGYGAPQSSRSDTTLSISGPIAEATEQGCPCALQPTPSACAAAAPPPSPSPTRKPGHCTCSPPSSPPGSPGSPHFVLLPPPLTPQPQPQPVGPCMCVQQCLWQHPLAACGAAGGTPCARPHHRGPRGTAAGAAGAQHAAHARARAGCAWPGAGPVAEGVVHGEGGTGRQGAQGWLACAQGSSQQGQQQHLQQQQQQQLCCQGPQPCGRCQANTHAWQQAECSSRQSSFDALQIPLGGWQGELVTAASAAPAAAAGEPNTSQQHAHQQLQRPAQQSVGRALSGGAPGNSDHDQSCPPHLQQQQWHAHGNGPMAEGLDKGGGVASRRIGFTRDSTVHESETGDEGGGSGGPHRNTGIIKRMATMLGTRKLGRRKNEAAIGRGSMGIMQGYRDGASALMNTHESYSPDNLSVRSNSFNFLPPQPGGGPMGGGANTAAVMASKLQAGPVGQAFGPTKGRDPIAEEVAKSTFSLKIMVSAGTVCVFHMGGKVDEVTDPTVPEVPRWEYFIGDRPLAPCKDKNRRRGCIAQLAAIEDHSEAGIVVLSREVLELVKHDWEFQVLPDDVFKILAPVLPFTIPTRTPGPSPFKPSAAAVSLSGDHAHSNRSPSRRRPPRHQKSMGNHSTHGGGCGDKDRDGGSGGSGEEGSAPAVTHEFSHLSEIIQRRAAGLLRMHVLGSVRSRIEAGHLDFINEIRPLTCIFLGFPSLLDERDGVPHDEQVAAVQFIVESVQDVMYKWDGSFMQFRCDEKGFVGICAFGLPGHTHEDNSSRGILAALELMKRIKDGQHRICVGVTTGDLLCTCVGARKMRSEYTVFGDAINLSARLMMKCRGGMGDILCDDPTFCNAKYKAKFEELEPLTVKGKQMPVMVYRVLPFDNTAGGGAPSTNKLMQKGSAGSHDGVHGGPPERPLVGRDAEVGFILQRATNMVSGLATGGAIVIEGNTGMGKTKLLMEVRKTLERVNLDTITEDGKHAFHLFYGIADIANKTQKLHPWRRIIHDLFAVDLHCGAQLGTGGARGLPQGRHTRRRSSVDLGAMDPTAAHPLEAALPPTLLGQQLAARFPTYNTEWRNHLSELFDLPLYMVPKGPSPPPPSGATTPSPQPLAQQQQQGHAASFSLPPSQLPISGSRRRDAHGRDMPRPPRYARQSSVELMAHAGQLSTRESLSRHSRRASGSIASLMQALQRPVASDPTEAHTGQLSSGHSSRRWSLAQPAPPPAQPDLALPSVLALAEPHLLQQPRSRLNRRLSVDAQHMEGFAPHTLLHSGRLRRSSVGPLSNTMGMSRAGAALLPLPSLQQQLLQNKELQQYHEQHLQQQQQQQSSSSQLQSARQSMEGWQLAASDLHPPSVLNPFASAAHHPVSSTLVLPTRAPDPSAAAVGGGSSADRPSTYPPYTPSSSSQTLGVVGQLQLSDQRSSTQLPMPPTSLPQPAPGPDSSGTGTGGGVLSMLTSLHSRSRDTPGGGSSSGQQAQLPLRASGGPGSSLGSRMTRPSADKATLPLTAGLFDAPYASGNGDGSGGNSASYAVPPAPGLPCLGSFQPPSRTLPEAFRQLSVDVHHSPSSTGAGQVGGSVLTPILSSANSMGRPPLRMSSSNAKGVRLSKELSTSQQQQQQQQQQQGADVAEAIGGVGGGGNAQKKDSLNFVVHIVREFALLYGPVIILLENLHEFDTWSWQLLAKIAEVLTPNVLVLATTRPNEPPVTTANTHHLHGKAALTQKVAVMYRHLLKLPTTSCVYLEPFTFKQTEALMKVVSGISYPEQYVLAVMEKTGGMPLYTEKVTEFLCQKPWLADPGGEFAANVNKMIRNLNFQQVIIERMDRLKPGVHLTLKVASVMGQWVDLDILHRFYPINKSKDELRGHLIELERGNFLKPTDTEGVWEFNMVERDIVYEVIPHYQRRRLHAKLAQELEHTLEEYHVATLTTIAYHWNQACMGNEVTEVECALKAIEHWHRAAEAAYSGSLLMEALRLYQKAGQIAEVLGESMGESEHMGMHEPGKPEGRRGSAEGGSEEEDDDDDVNMAGNTSFTAVGSAYRGQLNWSLISRIMRAQWEKAMASCCLGIVLQHRYESHAQLEMWETQDYFQMLTEHAIRGLMLLGTPDPYTVLAGDTETKSSVARFFCCCFGGQDQLSGWEAGVELQDQEITEIRDILLVLIIAAEHYSLQHDGDEYIRLLTFCKCVCKFLNKCSDSGTDPFMDIFSACVSRIKHYKATRHIAHAHEMIAEFSIAPVREDAAEEEYAEGGWEDVEYEGSLRGEMVGVNRSNAVIMAGPRPVGGLPTFEDPSWSGKRLQ